MDKKSTKSAEKVISVNKKGDILYCKVELPKQNAKVKHNIKSKKDKDKSKLYFIISKSIEEKVTNLKNLHKKNKELEKSIKRHDWSNINKIFKTAFNKAQ